MRPAHILVTRPQPQAQAWVQALQARGLNAQALPLIAITAPTDQPMLAALCAAREQLAAYHAVMLVSASAAQHFCDAPTLAALAATSTRIWAPGPGTARVVQALGVAASRIDQPADHAAQFDSEALWAQVGGQIQPGMRVLIVRGLDVGPMPAAAPRPASGTGRDWLAQQLHQAGAEVDFVVAYLRGAPHWTAAQQQLAQTAAHDGSCWLFSSGQALAHLRALLPGQSWAQAQALATHPRIAQAATATGFGRVDVCRPSLADVCASIESLP